MIKRKKRDVICVSIMTLFVGTLLLIAIGYPDEVRLVPFVIGFPTICLLIVLLVGEFYPGIIHIVENAMEELWGGKATGGSGRKKPSEFTEWRPVLGIMGWAVLFYIFAFLFGLVIVPPFFIGWFLLRKARLKWSVAIPCSLLVSALIYFGMAVLLKVDLWPGAIPTIIPNILGGAVVPPL